MRQKLFLNPFAPLIIGLTIMLGVSIFPVYAQSKNAPAATPLPDTMNVADCLGILAGLNTIDSGRQVIINAGKPNEAVVSQPYEFGNAKLRLDIAHNISLLAAIQRDAQTTQQKIFAEVSKGSPEIKPGSAEAMDYDKQLKELTSRPCNVSLAKIKDADLKLDKNEIPSSALALIDRIREK